MSKNLLYLVSNQVVVIVLGFAASVLIARSLGPEGKGYYDLIFSTATLLVTFTGLSLASGIFYYASREPLHVRRLYVALIVVTVVQVLVALAGLWLLQGSAPIDLLLPGIGQSLALWLLPLVMLVQQSGRFAQMLLSGQARFRSVSLRNIGSQALSGLLLLCLFAFGSKTPWHFIAATLVASSINIALSVRELWTLPVTSDRLFLKEALIYSLPLALGNVVQFLNYKLDLFIVNWFHGLYSVGIYTLAVSLAQLLWLLPNNLATLILQRAAADHAGHWLPEQVAMVSRISLWLGALIAVAMAITAPWLTGLIFGERFAASVPPLLLLLPGIVLFTVTIVLSGQLAGVGKQMLTTHVAIAAFICTLALDLLLIPSLGVNGAAIASTCSYALSTWLTWRYFEQLYPDVPLGSVFLLQRADLHSLWALLQRVYQGNIAAKPFRKPNSV